MEVSQIKELDTHAIIGGGKAQAFGMSDSPEFFTVLSDTLYRDKKLAVVREVVCNAWDAHIMAGKLDLPVEITLTNEELIVKDFGPGIPHDKIGPIYCVYGNSTKVRDDTQTGGFGLGCKAPFAYSDHFSVTNCHAGKRVVYALSRGGEETNGKPSFQPMVSVPSNDTGVVVSVPLGQLPDVAEFEKLIRRVVYQGGMLVTLNGVELARLDYTEAHKTGMALVAHDRLLFPMTGISVLYGTVVYPVTTTDDNVTRAASKLNDLIESSGRMILIAPPNSIGVQPSREGLSYSDKTTETIMGLLANAERKIRNHQIEVARKVVRKRLEKRFEKDKSNFTGISTSFSEEVLSPVVNVIADPELIAFRAVEQRVNRVLTGATLHKVAGLEMARMFRDDRRFFRREAYNSVNAPNYSFSPRSYQKYPHNRVRTPLFRSAKLVLRLAARLDLLNKLCVANYGYYPYSITKIDHASQQLVVGGKLILAPSQKAAKKYVENLKEKRPYGEQMPNNPIFVLPGSSPELRAKVIAEAKRLKIKTIELEFPQRKKPGKATKEFFDLSKVYKDRNAIAEVPTLEDPQVYMRVSGDALGIRVTHERLWRQRKTILELFPKVALAFNAKQEAKLKAKKVPDIASAIVTEVKKLSRSRDVLYHWLIHGKAMFKEKDNYFYHNNGASVAHKLATLDTSLAKELLPARVKFGENAERVKRLLAVLSDACHDDRGRSTSSDDAKIEELLTKKARETFPELVIENEDDGRERFDYLNLVNTYNLDRKNIPDVLEVVRLLKRRRARNDKSAVTDEARKEAA